MSALQSLRLVGGVVPPALVSRIQAGEVTDRESLSASSYHLVGTETVRDAASRSWGYLSGAWTAWREADSSRTAHSAGTGAARDRWLLPLLRELGYGQVPPISAGLTVDGQAYPLSHLWGHVPIHLLGPGVDLDRRNLGVAGAARAPQAMVQELLNRSDQHLWAVLSNGLRLRLLRDSTALAGSAYVEFDLEAIFDGELYAEWQLLFQLCHVSRLEKRGDGDAPPSDCWLESWRGEAVDAGTRALDRLRDGVERALGALGSGFLRHPRNSWLVQALRDGELTERDYHRALLRLVYRLLFCFVAEDRGMLLDPDASRDSRERYLNFFSTTRLRRLSRLRAGGLHPDLWQAQRLVLTALGGEGMRQLAVPAVGGIFDAEQQAVVPVGAPDASDLLGGAELANADLLAAVRALAWVTVRGQRVQPVDYRNLGAEELGSVYESLLELIPRIDLVERRFTLELLSGNERKTTGSYYTPPGLVSALLDSALDPVLDDAVKDASDANEAARSLLALRVCDPACGSGGFLVAAARRIARRLAQIRAGDDEPTPVLVQHALREVVGECIYGVDLNDLAAELAKVSLWLEALEPGKPLGFLDARIRVGNALLGATPTLLAGDVPGAAFKEIEGDDKAWAAKVRRRNATEAGGQEAFAFDAAAVRTADLATQRRTFLEVADDVEEARAQAGAWHRYERSTELRRIRLHADAWCSAFVWRLAPGAPTPPTSAVVRQIAADPGPAALADTVREVDRLAEEYRFFHWHLEFPEVFGHPADGDTGSEGWPGGFSCLVGNPPWERVKVQEQEFFAARDPEIATASNAAARRGLIAALRDDDPILHATFLAEKRRAEGQSVLLRTSGRFPFNGRGDVNTYAVFAELFRSLTGPHGRAGVIAPTGIATDATTQYFFKDLVATASLASLFDFENSAPIFEGVHRSFKFSLLTMTGRRERVPVASFAFFLRDPADLGRENVRFELTPEEILLLNPNTGTCPVFRTRRDAEITLGIYRRVPVLIRKGDPNGNPWGITFMTMFHMANDSELFRSREQLEADGWTLDGNVFVRSQHRMLPLYEAKMIHHYDHRWATYERGGFTRDTSLAEKQDPNFVVLPRYWVAEPKVNAKLHSRWDKRWLIGWRNITNTTNERTTITGMFPLAAVGHSTPLVLGEGSYLLAVGLSSLVSDYVARQKLGGTNFTFNYFEQLAQLSPHRMAEPFAGTGQTVATWLNTRMAELAYTAWDVAEFARDLGDSGPPFVWAPERRASLRAELDAAFFLLYGVERDDVAYILDTFPILKRKDEERFGEYRTRRLILDVYHAMSAAIASGEPYRTDMDPPPGHGPRHPAREPAV